MFTDEFFNDPNWKSFGLQFPCDGSYARLPNRLRFKAEEKIGAVEIHRDDHRTFPLHQDALSGLVDALNAGDLVSGYVVLIDDDSHVVAWKKIEEVLDLIGHEPCRPGSVVNYYWWLDENFKPSWPPAATMNHARAVGAKGGNHE
jgi:hypothetical protein